LRDGGATTEHEELVMTVARTSLIATLAAAVALALSACGTSDEEQIRAAVADLLTAFDKRDPERACGLLTPRAEAQFVGFLGGFAATDRCDRLVKKLEPDSEPAAMRDVRNARLTIRGDRAILTPKKDTSDSDQGVGLRKLDGDWQIDNILNPSLDERPRGEQRLTRGSDEQQIRATLSAANTAIKDRDYERMCNLLSYGAEAQVMIGAAFASIAGSDEEEPRGGFTCAWAWRALESFAEKSGDGGFADEIPSPAQARAARVAVRGSSATVSGPGADTTRMIRIDGRWLIDTDAQEAPTPAEYERCWRGAGARIATHESDLSFARAGDARHVVATTSHISIKGKNWRIFYTLPENRDDPGLHAVLRDPDVVAVVAYVTDAPKHEDVVAKARSCGDE
jgi:hypothetical protein